MRGAAERVYQVYHWAHERCRQRMSEGGLDVPGPVLATLFTSLQKGLDNFEHCRWVGGWRRGAGPCLELLEWGRR